MYVTINPINNTCGEPFEMFATLGKTGGCSRAYSEALCRLISLALRCGIDRNEIVKQLEHTRCPNPVLFGRQRNTSCIDGLAQILRNFPNFDCFPIQENPGKQESPEPEQLVIVTPVPEPEPPWERRGSGNPCPECGDSLVSEGGCFHCNTCGYEKCW